MLFRERKRIAALIMAVVMMFTTVFFVSNDVSASNVATPTDAIETEVVEEITTETIDEVTSEEISTEVTTEVATEETTEETTEAITEAITELTTESISESGVMGTISENDSVETGNESIPEMSTMSLNRATGITVSDKVTHYCDGNELTQFTLSNGQIAICMEFGNTSADWNSPIEEILVYTSDNTSMVYKVMYYGYNGPEQWSGFGNESNAIVGTGVLLSYLTTGTPDYALNSPTVSGFYSYIQSAPTPPKAQMSFSPAAATTSVENGVQKTNLITFNADSRLSVSLKLDNDMKLYFDGSTTANTGNVTVKGGQKFYITAPLTRDADFSQTVTYNGGKLINVMQAVPAYASSGIQKMAYSTKQSLSTNISIDFKQEKGTIKVHKKPADEEMANSISCYSDLSGANFAVFKTYAEAQAATAATQHNNAVAIIVTDKNGEGSATDLPMDTYYIKETVAPKNYKLSNQIYTVTVNSPSVPAEFNAINELALDPFEIAVEKENDKGNRLEGAEFTIKYYALQQDTPTPVDPATLGYEPIRMWVIKSDVNGQAKLRDSHKVSGDDFFVSPTGVISLPVGTITIQETKAPEGHVIDNTVRVQSVRNDADLRDEHFYNTSIIPNSEQQAQIKVYKIDRDKKHGLKGAEFELYEFDEDLKTKEDYVEKGVLLTSGTTDESGELLFDGYYPLGKLVIIERKAPEGYISEDNIHVIVAEGDDTGVEYVLVEDTFDNKPIGKYGRIDIVKTGEDRTYNEELGEFENKEIVLEGIKFEIYAEEDLYDKDGELIYASGTLVETVITDENGEASTSDNLPLGKYRVHEEVPAGYVEMEDVYVTLSEECDVEMGIDEEGDEKKVMYSVLDIKNKLLIPEIRTTAKDSVTLNNVADPSATTTSIDTISHVNLIPGMEYDIKTVIMDKDTGKVVIVNGKELVGNTKYKPTAAVGTVDISLTYNSQALAGKKIVFFEYIYLDGKLVALHTDINNEGQTITFTTPPPETPPTGDGAPLGIVIGLMVLACAGLIGMICVKKLPKKIK
ncbi:MAG: VaFE repeat-containing surface-anchored protein [Lachnospiraceae bacterium]|nr:VaFE repeat-containing surface-anchored protein [Lachnospiraceae bacterium]